MFDKSEEIKGGKYMFKKITGVLLAVALGLLCAWPAAAKPRPVMGSEQHKTQDVYTVTPFTALSVNGQTEVEFKQGPEGTYTVSFTGPYNLAEMVNITSKDGTLHIHYKEDIAVLGDQHLRVFVTAPDLKRIEVRDSGEVHAHTALSLTELEIIADGKSDIELDDVQAQFIRAEISGEADVEFLSLMCQTLQVAASGNASFDAQRTDCDTVSTQATNRAEISISGLNGKTITSENWHSAETELKGRVEAASLTARGHSQIDAGSLQAENADVMAERSAHIGVRVSDTLNAQTEGRGVVEYKGWPQQVNRTGKGTVKQNR